MGWSFRKRIRVAPGITLNLNKGLPSVTVGSSPVSMNIGRRPRATVSVPGSGLSASTSLKAKRDSESQDAPSAHSHQTWSQKFVRLLFTGVIMLALFYWLRR